MRSLRFWLEDLTEEARMWWFFKVTCRRDQHRACFSWPHCDRDPLGCWYEVEEPLPPEWRR